MKVEGQEIFVGCDPEVFVIDSKTKRNVPAHDLIKGDKHNPQLVKNGMIQVDGLALEFGIDPASTEDEFFSRIRSVLGTLQAALPKGLELNFVPSVVFNSADINSLPPEALVLGCEPDFNAYTLKANEFPQLSNPNMRSAGGHVHVGWGKDMPITNKEHLKTCALLAAEMDYRLGVPSLHWDSNSTRRSIYGGPGAFRPKPYGMEYRTLSNQWLMSEDLIRFVYRQTIKSVRNAIKGEINFNENVRVFNGSLEYTPKAAILDNFGIFGKVIFERENKYV